MDDYAIRIASPADAYIISQHRRAMFYEMGHTETEALNAATSAFEVWAREKIDSGDYVGWVVEDGTGQVVAGAGLYLIAWPPGVIVISPALVYVMNVYTEAAHRGRGLARRLTETILEWSRQQGYQDVALHASDMGRPIYEKLGFSSTSEMRIKL